MDVILKRPLIYSSLYRGKIPPRGLLYTFPGRPLIGFKKKLLKHLNLYCTIFMKLPITNDLGINYVVIRVEESNISVSA